MSDKDGTLLITYREDEGEVDQRRLAGMLGAATTVMLLFVIVAFSLGMVGAALGVGIGGFVANFGTVTADQGGVIYPVIGEQAACDNAPQLEASLDGEAVVDDYVEFYKDLPLPNEVSEFGSTNPGDQFVRLTILSDLGSVGNGDNVTAQELDLRLTALEAQDVVIGNASDSQKAEIREFGPSDYNSNATDQANASYLEPGHGELTAAGDTPEFGIDAAGGFSLVNGSAAAHQVAFSQISLPTIDLAVNIIDDTTYSDSDSGPIPRVVDPTNRTCADLADTSRHDSYSTPGNQSSSGMGNSAGYPSDY